jgi:hypothetical protein
MNRPDLNRMWETFIRIPRADVASGIHVETIRKRLAPMIDSLLNNRMIDWYCFLIHDKTSGVPTNPNDEDAYFHVRLGLQTGSTPDMLLTSLPDYCTMTRPIEATWVENILGIDKTLLKNEDIGEAWKVIGEQSEWLLKMLNSHKEETNIFPTQMAQFLHYFSNMTQLRMM